MVVYYEYVLIDNFVIDYLLLSISISLSGKKANKIRVVLLSLLGAGISLIFPLISLPSVLMFILKLSIGLMLLLFSYRFSKVKLFIKTAIIFFLLTFLTGGAIMGIYGLMGKNYNAEIPVATMFIPAYIILKITVTAIKRVVKDKGKEKMTYKVKLISGENHVTTTGLLDTGNALYCEGNPAIVVDKKIFKKLLGINLMQEKLKLVAVTTVSGQSNNLSFNVQEMEIYFKDKPNILYNVTAVVSKTHVSCGVILHPDFLGE